MKHLFTIGASSIHLICALVVTSILSHGLIEELFASFVLLQRYLGFFVALCGGGLGYAVVAYVRRGYRPNEVVMYSASISLVFFFVGIKAYESLIDVSFYIYTWVLSQFLFHIFSSLLRGLGHITTADIVSLLIKAVGSILVAVWLVSFDVWFEYYFFVMGCLALIVMLLVAYFLGPLRDCYSAGPKKMSCYKFVEFAWSRYVDNLLRLAFPFLIVLFSEKLYGPTEASMLALVVMLIKAGESALLPLTYSLYSKVEQLRSDIRTIMITALIILQAIVSSSALFFGEEIVEVWLGDGFHILEGYIFWGSFVVFPIAMLAYFKVYIDANFTVSPFMLLNLAFVLLGAVFAGFSFGVLSLLLFFVLSYWIKMLAVILFHLRAKRVCIS